MKKILAAVRLSIIILIPMFASKYLDMRFESISLISSLRQKELIDGAISYAYITMFGVILSMNAIIFALSQGMIQNMATKVRYRTYENTILKDEKSVTVFQLFACISFSLLVVYLFSDISAAPLTFTVYLFESFILVILSIIYLYRYLFRGFSLYSIVKTNREEISKKYKRMDNKLEKLNDSTINTRKHKRLKLELEILEEDYLKLLFDTLDDYSYIAANAINSNDLDLYCFVLSNLTEIGSHRINDLGSPLKVNEVERLLGKNQEHDIFLSNNLFPFYFKHINNNINSDFYKCSNSEYTRLLLRCEDLKYSNVKDYSLTFYIACDEYKNGIVKQVEYGYFESIQDFRNSMVSLINAIDTDYSENAYRMISDNVLELAEKTLHKVPIVFYFHLTEIFVEILNISLYKYKKNSIKNTTENYVKLLALYISMSDKLKHPFTMSFLNDKFFNSINRASFHANLRALFDKGYSDKISDNRRQVELSSILREIYEGLTNDKSPLTVACLMERDFFYWYANFIKTCADIALEYSINDVKGFRQLILDYQKIYSFLAQGLSKEHFYERNILIEMNDSILVKSIDNKELFGDVFNEYLIFICNCYANIKNEISSYMCFLNIIWILTFEENSYLINTSMHVLKRYLDKNQIAELIEQFSRDWESRSAPTAYKYYINYDDNSYENLLKKMNELINSEISIVSSIT